MTSSEAVPETMRHLPLDHLGRPVPYAVAWSSERWSKIDYDPICGALAVFTDGGPGIGRPVLGILNEVRQRRCVVARRCQVCGRGVGDDGLVLMTSPQVIEVAGVRLAATAEPACCEPCLSWAKANCPGLAQGPDWTLLRLNETTPVAQWVDPSRAPMKHAGRFDHPHPPEWWRAGVPWDGAVGLIKLAVRIGEGR